MLFVKPNTSNDDINAVTNFIDSIDNEISTVSPDEALYETNVSKYITSLANSYYAKSVEDIANTKVGNKRVKKRNLQQIMKESFFCGANRFGNNFIA